MIRFYTQESSLIPEISAKISAIFSPKNISEEWRKNAEILRNLILNESEIPAEFNEFKSNLMKKSALKGKAFFMPLRLLLTNSEHGPELSELFPLIRDEIRAVVAL